MSLHRHRPSNQRYKMLFETLPNYILGAILLFFLFLGLVSTSISFFANDANQTKEFIAQNSQDMNAVLVCVAALLCRFVSVFLSNVFFFVLGFNFAFACLQFIVMACWLLVDKCLL